MGNHGKKSKDKGLNPFSKKKQCETKKAKAHEKLSKQKKIAKDRDDEWDFLLFMDLMDM